MTKSSTSYKLDSTVRPQDDFYEYVNNIWLKEHPIPDSESRWGTFVQLHDETWQNLKAIYDDLQTKNTTPGSIQQQVGDFYYTGMHYDELSEVHLKQTEGLFDKIDAVTSSQELSSLIGTLHAFGIEGPWAMFVDVDDTDSSQHIVRVHQEGLTLPDRDYYLEETEKLQEVRVKFKEHILKVYQYFPRLADSADVLLDTVYGFEYELAKVSRSSVALRDVEKNYNKISFSVLKANYPNIDWNAYAKALGWKPSDKISVNQPEFLSFVNRQIALRSLNEWKVYLKWRVVMECYGKINEELSRVRFGFFGKVLSGTTEMMPLWKRVVATADDALGEMAGRLYAKRHFPESSKQQVLDIVEQLRHTYYERIEALDWMSDDTKIYALKKLQNIKVLIGYPDKWRDFSKLEINRTSYLGNYLAAMAFEKDYWFEKLEQPTSRDDWLMDPQTINAYNDPNRLVICFPAAILQPPFFDPGAHIAANLGGIGAVIGHEFTHGFDDQGCQFDAEGNVRTWQTPKEREAFKQKAEVISKQADQFEVLPGLNLKGGLVIGESIADLGGIEIAFDTFKKSADTKKMTSEGMTAEQLFFVNFARTECSAVREEKLREYTLSDPHPISTFRVNGMLRHVDDFYQAYQIKPSDALYLAPEKRAEIW